MSGPLRDRVFVSGVSLGKASSKNEPRKIRVAAGGPVADLILAAYRDGQIFPITLSGDVLAMRSPNGGDPLASTYDECPVWELDVVIVD